MIVIGDVVVSEEILEERFHCDVSKCKGMCCVDGDAGAPLEHSEIPQMQENLETVKPFMEKKGIDTVEEMGVWDRDGLGEKVTPLVDTEECAFAVFEENGIVSCAFEKAYFAGKSSFRKPISCHLYPIRISKAGHFDQLQYHAWSICKTAIPCGKRKDMPVFRFVKDALIRKYGEAWFEQMEYAAAHYRPETPAKKGK